MKLLITDPVLSFTGELEDTNVKHGDPFQLSAKVALGPSKALPTVRWLYYNFYVVSYYVNKMVFKVQGR